MSKDPEVGDAVHIDGYQWFNPQTRVMEQDHRGEISGLDSEEDPDNPIVYVTFTRSRRTDEFGIEAFERRWNPVLNSWVLDNVK